MLQQPIQKVFRESARLFNQFLRAFLSFVEDKPEAAGTRPLKMPITASANVRIVIKITKNIDTVVISCSQNKLQILSTKDLPSSVTFSIVCLILASCVRRSF